MLAVLLIIPNPKAPPPHLLPRQPSHRLLLGENRHRTAKAGLSTEKGSPSGAPTQDRDGQEVKEAAVAEAKHLYGSL